MVSKRDIQELEVIIGAVVSLSANANADGKWAQKALVVIKEMDQKIQTHYLNALKDEPLRRQVRFFQALLTRQSDQLFSRGVVMDKTNAEGAALQTVLEGIEAVLKKQKSMYGSFFDVSQPVSHYFLSLLRADLKFLFQNLYEELPESGGEIKELLDAIRIALEQLMIAEHGNRPSYEDLKHITYFMQMLTNAGKHSDALITFHNLMKENLNAPEVIAWYQKTTLATFSVLNEHEQRSFIEAEEHKWLSVAVSPIQLNAHLPNGPEQLLAWLSKLKHQKVLDDHITGRTDRLPLSLSVAQFGLFLRLCYLTGCFHEQNISELLRFFIRHFNSKKQEHISKQSLAKAFYSAEFSTAVSGRAWLQRMIDHLNKKYFPK